MKGRESGMPEESYWQTFFDADSIVEKMECAKEGKECIAEFGSGYGTFTFPAAMRTSGIVYAFDIESELVALIQRKAQQAGLSNVQAETRDFVALGTGLPSESIDHSMVYNLLHIEEPVRLLREACRILKPGGVVSIIHWKYDSSTPRGPSMDIRPRPEQCRSWAEIAGFVFMRDQDLSECCEHHYGLLLMRPYRSA
ncbi:MAG: class I SAM-dependent methyltransferase [Desulfuromonadaceae bacterium]|nr:class I SAM-dependent methyltransferase [Desulfuromonadaceae bacterium]